MVLQSAPGSARLTDGDLVPAFSPKSWTFMPSAIDYTEFFNQECTNAETVDLHTTVELEDVISVGAVRFCDEYGKSDWYKQTWRKVVGTGSVMTASTCGSEMDARVTIHDACYDAWECISADTIGTVPGLSELCEDSCIQIADVSPCPGGDFGKQFSWNSQAGHVYYLQVWRNATTWNFGLTLPGAPPPCGDFAARLTVSDDSSMQKGLIQANNRTKPAFHHNYEWDQRRDHYYTPHYDHLRPDDFTDERILTLGSEVRDSTSGAKKGGWAELLGYCAVSNHEIADSYGSLYFIHADGDHESVICVDADPTMFVGVFVVGMMFHLDYYFTGCYPETLDIKKYCSSGVGASLYGFRSMWYHVFVVSKAWAPYTLTVRETDFCAAESTSSFPPTTTPTGSQIPTESPTDGTKTNSPTFGVPSQVPSSEPTDVPTGAPIELPTETPSADPTVAIGSPTTASPVSDEPTKSPTNAPTKTTTAIPTRNPKTPQKHIGTSPPTATPQTASSESWIGKVLRSVTDAWVRFFSFLKLLMRFFRN